MIEITDVNDSRIGLYRNLKDISFSHSEKKLFIAEGSIIVKKLLRSKLKIHSLFATKSFYDEFSDLFNQKYIPEELQFIADKNIMNRIVGFRLHQGIMALAEIPDSTDILNLQPPIIVLHGIVNSENVGAIVRNAVAFGINSFIYDKQTSSPFLRRAVRVSMGTVFSVNYFHSSDLIEDLIRLKSEKDVRIIASEINRNSIPINEIKFTRNSVIVFGSEGKGISEDILNICDKIVHIPITSEVQSLNVASSSAIILSKLNQI